MRPDSSTTVGHCQVHTAGVQVDIEGADSSPVNRSGPEEDVEDVGGVQGLYVELALDHSSSHHAADFFHPRLRGNERFVGVVPLQRPEEEDRPVVCCVCSANKQHGGSRRGTRNEAQCDVPSGVSSEFDGQLNAVGHRGAGGHDGRRREQTGALPGGVAAVWGRQAQFSDSAAVECDVHLSVVGKGQMRRSLDTNDQRRHQQDEDTFHSEL